jgi:micrococcal nuclease
MFTYTAMITKIVDGDTVHADIDLGFHIILKDQVLRLRGINTPEIKGTQKPEGLVAKGRVEGLILGRTVQIKTYKDKREKYGRILADIFLGSSHINEILVKEGYAEPYMVGPPEVSE